jgi:hypothetical protein
MDEFTIEYSGSYSGSYLNVQFDTEYGDTKLIEMDINERLYKTDVDGKNVFSGYDIENKQMESLSDVVYEMSVNRKRAYDNQDLLYVIFDKQPEDTKVKIIEKLYDDMDYEDQEKFFTKLDRNRKLDELI